MANIFHIVEKTIWEMAKANGAYFPKSLIVEGFIHCSKLDQVVTVANSFYAGSAGLILLKIDESKVNSKLVYEAPLEAPQSGIKFPHIYGELNLDAVVKEVEFPSSETGEFVLPLTQLNEN